MKLKVVRHKTLENCMVKFLQGEEKISKKDALKSFMVGFDGQGKKYEIKVEDYCKNPQRKCWGFLKNKKEIHLWVADDCQLDELVGLIGHEYGHHVEPYYKSQKYEEIKAEKYGEAARFAYEMAIKILN